MNMKRMAISATMVIMITTIVATSTALAASDATIRTYGEDVRSAAFPYMDTEAPFDPPSDVAPSKDFVDKHDTTYGTVQATGRSYRMRSRSVSMDVLSTSMATMTGLYSEELDRRTCEDIDTSTETFELVDGERIQFLDHTYQG